MIFIIKTIKQNISKESKHNEELLGKNFAKAYH